MKLPLATANLHIAIRAGAYADPFGEEKLEGDIVKEHNQIVSKHQTALLGKLGRLPDSTKLELLRDSIQEYNKAKLVLVRRTKHGYEGFAATLHNVYYKNDFSPELSLVPAYYHHLIPEIKLWFEVGAFRPMLEQNLHSLKLLSNGKPLVEVLSACRTSLMLVRDVEKTR